MKIFGVRVQMKNRLVFHLTLNGLFWAIFKTIMVENNFSTGRI